MGIKLALGEKLHGKTDNKMRINNKNQEHNPWNLFPNLHHMLAFNYSTDSAIFQVDFNTACGDIIRLIDEKIRLSK